MTIENPTPVSPGDDEDADAAVEALREIASIFSDQPIGSYSVVVTKDDGTEVQSTHIEQTSDDGSP